MEAFLHEYGSRIGPQLARLLPEVMHQLPLIDTEIAGRPFTLVHGDLRADNLMFGGDHRYPEPSILDWQTSYRSLGAMDVAYLIGGVNLPLNGRGLSMNCSISGMASCSPMGFVTIP
jgi:hypothetical protein